MTSTKPKKPIKLPPEKNGKIRNGRERRKTTWSITSGLKRKYEIRIIKTNKNYMRSEQQAASNTLTCLFQKEIIDIVFIYEPRESVDRIKYLLYGKKIFCQEDGRPEQQYYKILN